MIKNSKLQNLFKLHSRVTVYVPATINVNEHIDNTEYVDRIASNFSQYFGGATSTPALGYWKGMQGLVKEHTTIVFSYCDDESLEANIENVIADCEQLKAELKQEAIGLEINGEMYFI